MLPRCLPGGTNDLEKKLHQRVTEVVAQDGAPDIEVWYQDEARLGLKPIVRRVWARRGRRPIAVTCTRYEWLYVYGFVHAVSGRCYWLILPTVNTTAMSKALAEFARDVGAGPDKQIVLVVDNAGWHTRRAVELPPGIELFFLPAYTSELQPAERLWPLIREGMSNQFFAGLDTLQTRLVDRCLAVFAVRHLVSQHTTFIGCRNDETERYIPILYHTVSHLLNYRFLRGSKRVGIMRNPDKPGKEAGKVAAVNWEQSLRQTHREMGTQSHGSRCWTAGLPTQRAEAV